MREPLRIAQVAPIANPVAADAGSSIELLVELLARELTRRGHEVTVFATGDSRTPGSLHATYERGYHTDHLLWGNWEFHETMNAAAAFARAGDFDIIHSHAYHYGLPFADMVDVPSLHTYHVHPDPDILRAFARSTRARPVAVSRYHRGKFRGLRDVPVVHNGIDTASFPFRATGGDYLLFLGHLIPKKGPLEGIEVARRAGMRLVMAGHGDDYYRDEVARHVDGRRVEYVGTVDVRERNELLVGAAALLFPSVFAEPFGLVLVEAMACGTPVAALDRCAVPEIVTPGVGGYHAPDVDTLATRVADAVVLDRARVREEAVSRFDHVPMVDGYEALYRRVLVRSA